MPKHIIEFNLPEEREELQWAMKGIHYSIALDNIDNYLRSKLKYTELTEIQAEIYQEIRDMVNDERKIADEDWRD